MQGNAEERGGNAVNAGEATVVKIDNPPRYIWRGLNGRTTQGGGGEERREGWFSVATGNRDRGTQKYSWGIRWR